MKKSTRNLLFLGLAFLALVIAAAVGGTVYIGYLAKKKFDEIKHKVIESVQTATVKTSRGPDAKPGDTASSPVSYPEWKPPLESSGPVAKGKISLQPGLTIVTAIAQPLVGDYESIKRIEAISDADVRIAFSSDLPNLNASDTATGEVKPKPSSTRKGCARTVTRQDMQGAHQYWQNFCVREEESYPGTTAISASAQVLADLKSKGETPFRYQSSALVTEAPDVACVLKRVEATDLAIPVLVNDLRVQLPAVHGRCQPDFYDVADFYFLDDPDNPLALAWQLGENKLQVIKITLPSEAPQIEQSLSETGRAEVYGIYFDFASDTIRPESEPVLKEIADALAKNPAWKLRVEGHTDNVGGQAYNTELSNRRAAAVKQALAERYHVSADRLTTAGFGASRPKEPNDTLEGRARNRRVELVRF